MHRIQLLERSILRKDFVYACRVEHAAWSLLSAAELEALRKLTTPTVANAVERLTGGRRDETYTKGGVQCMFPELGVAAGYACTVRIISSQPPRRQRLVNRLDYWNYVGGRPKPKILVVQDMGREAHGAYWGEVNVNIHKALGCSAVLTDGYVRDIDETRTLGIHLFSAGTAVSHAWAHLEDFDCPVTVFGLRVNPGDLVHADQHGAVVIPHEVAHRIPKAAADILREESRIIRLCQRPDFSPAAIDPLVSPEY